MVRRATADRLYGTEAMTYSVWFMLASGELGIGKMSGHACQTLRKVGPAPDAS